jgi:hypothetical protein
MATEQISVADLVTIRDNLVTAYTAVSESPTSSYMLGERQFTYADRTRIWNEVERLTREILLRSTTYKAKGKNRMNFRTWG